MLRRIMTPAARRLFLVVLLLGLVAVLVSPARAAVTPTVGLSVPATGFIGEPVTFTATFDNTGAGTETGFGPYIDLFLPIGGADGTSAGGPNDGLGFTNATYLGAPVASQTLTCAPLAVINHPFVPNVTVTCPALPVGFDPSFTWQFVSVELPFGSFTADQPPAVVTITRSAFWTASA